MRFICFAAAMLTLTVEAVELTKQESLFAQAASESIFDDLLADNFVQTFNHE